MNKRSLLFIIAALILSVLPLAARKTYVVAVGIGEYQNNWQSQLAFGVGDAQIMSDVFNSRMNNTDVFMLTNSNATRDHILRVMRAKFKQAGPEDEIVLIYAAHGGDGVLTTYKQGEVIYNYELQNIMKDSRAGCKLILMSSCHSGSMAKKYEKNSRKQSNLQNSNVILFLASRPTEVSAGVKYQSESFFFRSLYEGMMGSADVNRDNKITIRELFNYVYPRVVELSGSFGVSQHPQMLGKFDDDMVIFNLNKAVK